MSCRRRAGPVAAGLVVGAGLLAACGGGSQIVVRPPTSRPTGQPSGTSTAPSAIDPRVTVTPSRHLHDGQIVHVQARGFGPNQSLVTIECLDLGSKTGQGDCNVAGLTPIAVDASGSGATNFTVRQGPFGSNRVSCSARHHCIVSVSQATASPTQTASAEIEFG